MTRHEKALQKLHEGTVIPANPLALDANRNFDEKGQIAITRSSARSKRNLYGYMSHK